LIKASVTNPSNPIFIIGLTEDNVQRLKSGQPIATPIASFGIDMPGQIVIMYGRTEQSITDDLATSGWITDQTVMHGDPMLNAIDAIPRKTDKLLIATVGLPRSGKSTWARSQSYPIVNPDSIRLAMHGQRFAAGAERFVWATAHAMVKALFLAGHSTVILDACNNTRKRRDEWQSEKWDTVFKVIPESELVCYQRASAEDYAEIVPVVERKVAEYEQLSDDEIAWP
jgi:AAA domain-containing protein